MQKSIFSIALSCLLSSIAHTFALRIIPDGVEKLDDAPAQRFPRNYHGNIGSNPALTRLSESQRKGLQEKGLPSDGYYLAIVRDSMHLFLLNKQLEVVAQIRGPTGGKDPRLFTFGDETVLSWVLPGHQGNSPKFSIQRLQLPNRASSASLNGPRQIIVGKNIGLMSVNGTLKALTWLQPEVTTTDLRPDMNLYHNGKCGIPASRNSATHNQLDVSTVGLKEAGAPTFGQYKNSINPILINNGQDYLGVMHVYFNDKDYHNRIYNQPKFRDRTYWHSFVIFDSKPPHGVKHTSKAFCIPNPEEGNKCEALQFIVSGVVEDGNLILTYGINPATETAKSAYVQMPLIKTLQWITGETETSHLQLVNLLPSPDEHIISTSGREPQVISCDIEF